MTSSAEYQREAQMARQGLSSTLDDLRDSATPGNLTREALSLARDSGLSIFKALADTTRSHPIPSLMIGAALVMMMTENRATTPANEANGPGLLGKAGEAMKDVAQSGIDGVRAAARGIGAATTAAATAVKDTASDTAESVKEAAGQIKTAAGGAKDQADGKMTEMMNEAPALASQAKSAIAKLIDEQPLVAAALGIAIGAAIGAAIPATPAEKEYLGKASAKARKAGQEVLSKVTEAASREAKAQGLGPDAISSVVEAAHTVVDRAAEILSEPGGGRRSGSGSP
ncbi:hypothetical protein [Vineibacter terrae]|uniref:hypothetical protein n=1 Tax=Vineibacter terrae TaxID=2586908 RepID=UPI002E35787A|nr:hypothetical protein [Vineibacter terrae]HEX2887890.1 hypothetical protein [Vineibacter terrae]